MDLSAFERSHEMDDLELLPTEARNAASERLDELSTEELLRLINTADHEVADAVERELANIARAVEAIVPRFEAGGRIFYIGAGTSGRLGILDAAECSPTFGLAADRVQGLIAGGEAALRSSVERAEDDPKQGAADLAARGFGAGDVLVGISASGRTPYVLGAVEYANTYANPNANTDASTNANPGAGPAKTPSEASNTPAGLANTPTETANTPAGPASKSAKPTNTSAEQANTSAAGTNTGDAEIRTGTEQTNTDAEMGHTLAARANTLGAVTVGVSCVGGSALARAVSIAITPVVGPEVLTGSTRMKAGTATKMVLNSLSTAVMVRTGRVFGNLMVDVRPVNEKLEERAVRIVATVAGVGRERAAELLKQGGLVKCAIVMGRLGVDREEAEGRLGAARGRLREALRSGG